MLIQEAFTDAAKTIGRDAGYRYIAGGPDRELSGPAPDPARRAFVEAGDRLKGEGVGKVSDSGLQILSDYPILAVRRAAFPADACAGFDCLANKGMVMVLLAVPGSPTPVAVINTHLNARKASGVSVVRAFEAWREQIRALDRFRAAVVPRGVPAIIAGDLNVGRSPERLGLARATVARWLDRAGGAETEGVLSACSAPADDCEMDATAAYSLQHNKDWQIALPAEHNRLVARRIDVPFGREADGSMLSDHMGYTVHYRFERIASRPAGAASAERATAPDAKSSLRL